MTTTELKSLIASGEGLYLDFKEAVNSDLGKSIAAFANSKGGQILIGVNDAGVVVGHRLTNANSSKIQDSAQGCDPAVDIAISTVAYSADISVTVITIPVSDRAPHRSTKGYFLRQGSSSIKMTTEALIQYINAKGRLSFDDVVYGSARWKAVFNPMLIDLFFEKSGIAWTGEADQVRVLRSLRAISKEDIPTNAGILFFSEAPTDYIPQSAVTCVAFKGVTKTHILDRQTLKADILSNVDDALLFLKKHLNFSRIITKGQGRDKLEIPETALREAVVNAIIHRDYNIMGGNVAIEVYDDRVEVSSPGSLPPGLDPKDFGSRSLARNSVLSDIMTRTPYMERLGSGIQRIKESLAGADLEDAAFEFAGFTSVVFRRVVERKVASDPDGDPLNTSSNGKQITDLAWVMLLNDGSDPLSDPLNDPLKVRYIQVLRAIQKERLNRQQLSEILNVPAETIKRDLSKLSTKGLIQFEGPKRGGGYVLSQQVKDLL